MSNRFHYYNLFVQEEVHDKFLLKRMIEMHKLDLRFKLELLDNLEDKRIVSCINFLEMVSGYKPIVENVLSTFKHGKRIHYVTLLVTLRRFSLYNFLDYLVLCVFPMKYKRAREYSGTISGNYAKYEFNDLSVFSNLPGLIFNSIKNERLLIQMQIGGLRNMQEIKYYLLCIGAPYLK